MAGLFGYEKGHYEVSLEMGERRLFPAVREAGGRGTRDVLPGQIRDGTDRRALHPAAYLAVRSFDPGGAGTHVLRADHQPEVGHRRRASCLKGDACI